MKLVVPVEEMASRYHAGESTYALAGAYGISQQTVWRRLHAAGVQCRKSGGQNRAVLPLDEMARRYRYGEDTYALGVAYGVSAETVRRYLLGSGVTMRFGGSHPRGGPMSLDGRGYLRTRDRTNKSCPVHRGCWEAHHGAVPDGHAVHHINGDRQDNRIENLACMTHGEHARLHCEERRRK